MSAPTEPPTEESAEPEDTQVSEESGGPATLVAPEPAPDSGPAADSSGDSMSSPSTGFTAGSTTGSTTGRARPSAVRGTDLGARIDGLASAVAAARGRLDDALLDDAVQVGERAAGRLRLSARHTVVAIAGATGSGKSSTFNALTGLDLSSTGVRRPTTSWATACVWGTEGAEEVLEWLGIPPRHQTMRDSMLDTDRADEQLDGVVLLDLPDHDSTEVAHHLEVDRLVELADLLVWVLDPQKYADAAIHDRYLAPLRTHADVMVVVLNHIDTIPEDRRDSMVADVRRLLDIDGLGAVPIYAVSARRGIGIDDLRSEIARRAEAKALARDRLEADVRSAAARLTRAGGEGRTRELPTARVSELEVSVGESAGLPILVAAIERTESARLLRAVAWPPIGLLSRTGRSPLEQLRRELGEDGAVLTSGLERGSTPRVAPVQRARLADDVRGLGDHVADGLGLPWAEAVRGAANRRLDELGDRLDSSLGATDLGVATLPGWVKVVRVVQWLLLLAALVATVWTVLLAVDGTLSDHTVAGAPLPVVVLVLAIALGIVLGLASRGAARAAARDRADAARRRMREAVHVATTELVAGPVAAELQAYTAVRSGLATAQR